MSARILLFGAGVLVVAFLGALAVFLLAPEGESEVTGLGRTSSAAFDQGMIEPGPYDAAYSRDGARVAVLSDRGLSLAKQGKQEVLLENDPGAASRIVDFAWMPGSRSLMVVEGPFNVTKLSVVDVEGKIIAAVPVLEPFSAGDGHGLAVDGRNRRAVTVSVTRDAIGGLRHLDLVSVDLQSGAVTRLTTTPDADETSPHFLDDDTIAFTREQGDRLEAVVMELSTGEVRAISPEGRRAFVVGTLRGGAFAVYQQLPASDDSPSAVEAVPTAGSAAGARGAVPMGTTVAGSTVIAVHPDGGEAIVRAPIGAGTTSARLRAQQLDPPPETERSLGSVPPAARGAAVPWASSPLRRKSWRSTSS